MNRSKDKTSHHIQKRVLLTALFLVVITAVISFFTPSFDYIDFIRCHKSLYMITEFFYNDAQKYHIEPSQGYVEYHYGLEPTEFLCTVTYTNADNDNNNISVHFERPEEISAGMRSINRCLYRGISSIIVYGEEIHIRYYKTRYGKWRTGYNAIVYTKNFKKPQLQTDPEEQVPYYFLLPGWYNEKSRPLKWIP
ncbi:MAG: hypothetical protein IJ766_09805 [Clostridia bacterium]|nr:hypothetical protein [Clostridia bacterium]